ncbi:MAG: hypothetical protein AMXMBFR52_20000 [Burkholderiales bacterium]
MKLVIKIAAGIILAVGLLWIGGAIMMHGAATAAKQELASAVNELQHRTNEQLQNIDASIAARHAERARLKAEREDRAQAERNARCYVITADGREINCPAPSRAGR